MTPIGGGAGHRPAKCEGASVGGEEEIKIKEEETPEEEEIRNEPEHVLDVSKQHTLDR